MIDTEQTIDKDLSTFRVDIKNSGSSRNDVTVSGEDLTVLSPAWARDEQGIGKIVQGSNFSSTIKIQALHDGVLSLSFRGIDKREGEERLPMWINYTSIKVNGKDLLRFPVAAWHDKPYLYEMPVKDGQRVVVEIEQQYTWDYIKANVLVQPERVKVDNITQETSGRLQLGIGSTCFESVILPSKTKKLYVFLSSGGPNYPRFNRLNTAECYDGVRVYIDDPTRHEINGNDASWYLGGKGKYTEYLATIIKQIAKVHNIKPRNITLVGSSNAGFVALQVATRLVGVKCIALNPQLSIQLYLGNQADEFGDKVGMNFHDAKYKDLLFANKFLKNDVSRFFLFFNRAARIDEAQMNLLQQWTGEMLPLGLNEIKENVLCYIADIDAVHPHNVVPRENFIPIIEDIIDEKISNSLGERLCNAFCNEMKVFWEQDKQIEDLRQSETV